jgi:TM2 domain-containing membrane protein YozV
MPSVDHHREQWFAALQQHTAESDKSWSTAFCLSLLFGWLGVDRFYLGSAWLGLIKLFTFGGFLWWWIIDIILLLCGAMRDGEGRRLKR